MFIAVSFIIIAQTILTTTHMCISRWVDKQIVESTYSGMLFGSKKEKNFQMNLRILMWRSESYQIKERESYEGDQESFSDDDIYVHDLDCCDVSWAFMCIGIDQIVYFKCVSSLYVMSIIPQWTYKQIQKTLHLPPLFLLTQWFSLIVSTLPDNVPLLR